LVLDHSEVAERWVDEVGVAVEAEEAEDVGAEVDMVAEGEGGNR
jgi:hypothetical protein